MLFDETVLDSQVCVPSITRFLDSFVLRIKKSSIFQSDPGCLKCAFSKSFINVFLIPKNRDKMIPWEDGPKGWEVYVRGL